MRVGFSYNKHNKFSEETAELTNSKWSHCFLILDFMPIEDDYLILESSFFGGVEPNFLSKYTNKETHNLEIFDIDSDYNNITKLKSYIGDSWGYLQAIGYLIAKCFHLKNNPFHDGIWCSEYVGLWLQENPDIKDLFDHLDLQKTTPQDLYEIMINDPKFKSLGSG